MKDVCFKSSALILLPLFIMGACGARKNLSSQSSASESTVSQLIASDSVSASAAASSLEESWFEIEDLSLFLPPSIPDSTGKEAARPVAAKYRRVSGRLRDERARSASADSARASSASAAVEKSAAVAESASRSAPASPVVSAAVALAVILLIGCFFFYRLASRRGA